MKIQHFFSELEDLNDSNYRFHLAKPVDRIMPASIIALSKDEWKSWQLYKNRGNGERFPAPVKYIFSFGQIKGNDFVFGGIFKILDRSGEEYVVELEEKYSNLVGRAILTYAGENSRGTVFTPNYILNNSKITEVMKTPYKGESFPGIENINHDYNQLKLVYENTLEDWRHVLSNIKGIYLLTDRKEGKHYVGSAKGESGIWGRWQEYISSCDGGNLKLRKLKKEKGEEYFKENFKFTILETMGLSVSSENIELRESFWKEKLLTREFGYNAN